MANFQRIPHKERVRQAKYRYEHEEKLGESRMRKFMKELEKAKCSCEPCVSEKERDVMDEACEIYIWTSARIKWDKEELWA